jgi:glycylpeptide N-tetradecanoyltransferase
LSKLKGDEEIPDEVVETVMEKVKAEGSLSPDEVSAAKVREALQQMKIMEVMKGNTGVGGVNKKDTGEHKVRLCSLEHELGAYRRSSSGQRNPSLS